MAHSPFQKIKMLGKGEPVLEKMVCPENLPCGTLDTTGQCVSFQVPPLAAQFNREPHGRQSGRYELYRGSLQDNISSDHQVALEMTSPLNEISLKEGLYSTE